LLIVRKTGMGKEKEKEVYNLEAVEQTLRDIFIK
jgi:hypothetical protein